MALHTTTTVDSSPLLAPDATLVFTDIAGSTRQWAADPVAMSRTLRDHDRLIAEVIDRHDGLILKHAGDGVCVWVPDPDRALRLASDVLDVSRSLIVSIRTAVHRGRVEARDGDYFGLTLSVITRILDVARGGQILVSEAAATRLSSRRRLRRLGSRRLRDLPGPVVLYELLPG